MNCQNEKIFFFSNFLKFRHFKEVWPVFRPIPMYETYAIQLHFLVQLFEYLSQWSGSICFIFCTRLYSKDIHCALIGFTSHILHLKHEFFASIFLVRTFPCSLIIGRNIFKGGSGGFRPPSPLGFRPSENGTEKKDNLSCTMYLSASVSLDFKT